METDTNKHTKIQHGYPIKLLLSQERFSTYRFCLNASLSRF